MKAAIAVVLVAFSVVTITPPATAGEGRVAEAAPVLDKERVASYSRATPTADTTKSVPSRKAHTNAKVVQGKVLRPSAGALSNSMSARGSYFYIYDAAISLRSDRDIDGYHSEFRVRFDADSLVGDALVYARLYLRRVGEADWQLYHTTDDFWLFGESGSDDYYVTTTLDEGFATGDYDVLIDLYEVGYSGIAATLGPDDVGELRDLPLEEVGLDVPIEIPGYSIGAVSTTLLIDADGDDHYSQFRIDFDPNAGFDGTYVYAKFWVRAQGGDWIEEHTSEDFLVDASGTADVYSLTADWVSGYPTATYDVQIDLYDAATGALVASAGSERPELSRIPLEDQSRDTRFNSPIPGGGGGDTTSRERGGGATGIGWLLALGLLALGRSRYKVDARRDA